MVRVRRLPLAVLDLFYVRHASLVHQARDELVAVVILWLVVRVVAQPPEERRVQDGVGGYVARGAAV